MHDNSVDKLTPSAKAVDDNRLYLGRFIAINGDMPITQLRREHIVRYRSYDHAAKTDSASARSLDSTANFQIVVDHLHNPKISTHSAAPGDLSQNRLVRHFVLGPPLVGRLRKT